MTAAINASMGGAITTTAPFSISANKTEVSGLYNCRGTTGSCPLNANITTDKVTVSTSGGSGAGPTYLWARVSGDTFTIGTSTAAATNFSNSVARNTAETAVYRCTVTRGIDVLTVDVTVNAEYTYASDGGVPPGEEP